MSSLGQLLIGSEMAMGEVAKDAAEEIARETGNQIELFGRYFTVDKLLAYAHSALSIFLVVLFYVIIYRLGRSLLRRVIGLRQKKRDLAGRQELATLENLLQSILFYCTLILALISLLSLVGIDMRGLIASAGIAGLAIAFISQSIIKDWISGVFIIVERQYGVGDWVCIGEHTGKVLSVTLRNTVLLGDYNEVISIPNGMISEIINYSNHPQGNVLDLVISYDEDLEEARYVLGSVCQAFNKAEEKELLDKVRLLEGVQDVREDGLVLRLSFSSSREKSWRLKRLLRHQSYLALQEAGIPLSHNKLYQDKRMDQGLDATKEDREHGDEALLR